MSEFTVYYVVGLPRTGSTFVGDRIARKLNIVNAGEVWQTFRSVALVSAPSVESQPSIWALLYEPATKNQQLLLISSFNSSWYGY